MVLLMNQMFHFHFNWILKEIVVQILLFQKVFYKYCLAKLLYIMLLVNIHHLILVNLMELIL